MGRTIYFCYALIVVAVTSVLAYSKGSDSGSSGYRSGGYSSGGGYSGGAGGRHK